MYDKVNAVGHGFDSIEMHRTYLTRVEFIKDQKNFEILAVSDLFDHIDSSKNCAQNLSLFILIVTSPFLHTFRVH